MQSKYLLRFSFGLTTRHLSKREMDIAAAAGPIPNGMIEGGWESLGVSGGMRHYNLAKAGRQHISVVPHLASDEEH